MNSTKIFGSFLSDISSTREENEIVNKMKEIKDMEPRVSALCAEEIKFYQFG